MITNYDDSEGSSIYMSDNPKELLEQATQILHKFDTDLENMEDSYILTTYGKNEYVTISIAGLVLLESGYTIDIFNTSRSKSTGITLATSLKHEHSYYKSHVNFLNAFCRLNTKDILNFVLPRCIVNLERIPSQYSILRTGFDHEECLINFLWDDTISSLNEFLEYYLCNFGKDTETGLERLIQNIVRFEQFIEEYLIYVPSLLN